jgi:Pregnancy-associated plasma protein-A
LHFFYIIAIHYISLTKLFKKPKKIMKKFLIAVSVLVLLYSCSKDENVLPQTEDLVTTNALSRKSCASDDVLKENLKVQPGLAIKMQEIEDFTKHAIANNQRLVNGKIEIPVVFNVLYRTTAENISLAQLQSQIAILNKDFNALNTDYNTSNNPYSAVRANVGITFVLDQVIRKSTTKTSWGTRDSMKKSSGGGIAPTSPTTKLNFWVCTIGGGILGYAQFPGGASSTDGVVCDGKYVGNTGTATAPFNLGRTATHEIGHWMNLRHIWGDAACGSDLVSDTPTHNTANYGVPAVGHRSTCAGTPLEMYMNYMDYTDDRGMYMFSVGQKARMDAIFLAGGVRASFRL